VQAESEATQVTRSADEVIGASQDIRNRGIAQDPATQIYVPFPQLPWDDINHDGPAVAGFFDRNYAEISAGVDTALKHPLKAALFPPKPSQSRPQQIEHPHTGTSSPIYNPGTRSHGRRMSPHTKWGKLRCSSDNLQRNNLSSTRQTLHVL
jgi:hypothetical protein